MNSKTMFARLCALILITISSAACHAAVISVQPVIAGFFDPITFVPLPPIALDTNPGFSVVVQVDVMMEVISLAPDEDRFGTAAFRFDLSSSGSSQIVKDPDAGGWAQNPQQVDINGPAPGGILPILQPPVPPLIPPPLDPDAILVANAATGFIAGDPRRDLGEAGSSLGVPFLLGSAFLEWDGLGEVHIKLDPIFVSAVNTGGIFVLGQAVPSNVLVLGTIPEPSAVVMLGGMLAVAGLRRRGN
jgi:hypothetical protein